MLTWGKYLNFYLKKFSSFDLKSDEELDNLRNRLFISILLITTPVCLLGYIPGIIVSIITKQLVIGIFDTVAMLAVLILFFIRKQSLQSKKIMFTITFIILGLVLLAKIGSNGPGIMILFCISILITLYQSKKSGYIAVVLNTIFIGFLLTISPVESLPPIFFRQYNSTAWIAVSINLSAFNFLLVQSVAYFIDRLNETLVKEKNLKILLEKESEQLIKAKEKAEESDKLKTAFLCNISHEIRTPLNAILGFGSLLCDPELENENRHEYMSIVKNRSDDLLNIVNDILDISRIEAGQMVINQKVGHLTNMMNELYSDFKIKKNNENKQVDFILTNNFNGLSDFITTDFLRVKQILSNFLNNAFKFTESGKIELGFNFSKDNTIVFFVSDTGIGISDVDSQIIFERFRQLEITISRKYGGTGLGLSISKGLADLLSGHIWFDSKINEGSTFYFSIPYIPANIPDFENGEQFENTCITNGKTFLIIEDDPINLMYLKKILMKFNCTLLSAMSGHEAIEVFRNNPGIDLILMDIRMPEISGLELTKIIKSEKSHIPIIAQTSYAMEDDRIKCLESGCDDFISKPIQSQKLLELITKYI